MVAMLYVCDFNQLNCFLSLSLQVGAIRLLKIVKDSTVKMSNNCRADVSNTGYHALSR